eukprot:NODE_537_length_7002_cov_0.281762.p2 type:complete len:357 gc:universal NODE_537_length_7002_cov_0.281762:1111-2181(+)
MKQMESEMQLHTRHTHDSTLSLSYSANQCLMSKSSGDSKAVKKLLIALSICLVIFLAELLGGVFAHSLALISDAMHMLSDVVGFVIALVAIWLSKRKNNDVHTYGYVRAEIIGAIASILLIYLLTGILISEAVNRINNPEHIDAPIMMLTSGFGLLANILMLFALGGHHHGPEHSHSNSNDVEIEAPGDTHHNSMNVRAAIIHVIGDLTFSIGVLVSSIIIYFQPTWVIVDPICTFLFSVIVLVSTISILRDSIKVLMEASPTHVHMNKLRTDLSNIHGIKSTHCLHVWCLSQKTALTVHVAVEEAYDAKKLHKILISVEHVVYDIHNIDHATIQLHVPHLEDEDHSKCCQELIEL